MSTESIDHNNTLDEVRFSRREQSKLEWCSYGSCDKAAGHDGVHRCRCGRKCDAPANGCAWHSTGRSWLDDLAKMSMRAAGINLPRWHVYKWDGWWRAARTDNPLHPDEFPTWQEAYNFAHRGGQ